METQAKKSLKEARRANEDAIDAGGFPTDEALARVTEREQKQLEADRAKVEAEMKAAIDAYNAKAGALDARVQEWNARNAPANDAAKTLEA